METLDRLTENPREEPFRDLLRDTEGGRSKEEE